MYLFNIFNETKENDHITTASISSDTKPWLFLSNSKNLLHILELSVISSDFMNQN